MIKFRLRCGNGHEYDSMFNSGDAFDKLQKAKQLVCEVCGDIRVEKGIMAPAIRTGERTQRIAEMDVVEKPEAPFVGEIRPIVEAANEGDVDAQKLLSQTVRGTVSSFEDLEVLAKHGHFEIESVVDASEPEDEAPKTKRKSSPKASRPPASTKADAKKKPKKVRRDVN